MKATASLFILLLVNGISAVAQLSATPVIKAWGIEQTMSGGAPPPPHQPNINRTTHSFFFETKAGVKVKVTAVWIGTTAYAVVEEPGVSNPTTGLTNANNTLLQVLATDTLKACTAQPSQLLGNEAVIVYQLNGETYFAPIKTLQHKHINLP